MEKLEKVLKELKKAGFNTRNIDDIKQHCQFLTQTDILNEHNWNIEYNKKDDTFRFEVSWSNQEITKEWLDNTNKIYQILQGGF